VLVSSAGIADRLPIEEVSEAFFDNIVNTNYKGAFFSVQKAIPYLNDGASVVLKKII